MHRPMDTIATIGISGRRLVVRSPYECKEALKAIPGASWSNPLRAWTYPINYRTVTSVMDALSAFQDMTITLAPEVRSIVDAGDIYEEAEKFRHAEGLPSAPISVGEDWDHQKRAYWWGENLPAVLYDVWMGGGKTRITVNTIQNMCSSGGRVLIVAPSNVCPVWPDEIRKHGHPDLPWDVVNLARCNGTARRVKEAVIAMLTAAETAILVYICNYEGVWRGDLGKWILGQQWDVVVLDESQAVKSPGSAVSRFFSRFHNISKKRICLSGTPLHNSPLDIYGQARFLDPSFFGTSFSNFRARYAVMGGYGGYEVKGYQNQEEFYQNFRRFTFSVEKDEVLRDIPDMVFTERYCSLSKEEMDIYRVMETAFVADLDGELVTAQNALVKLLKLQQITSGYVRTDDGYDRKVGESKEKLLQEVMDDIDMDEPIVVFCRFIHDLEAVHRVVKSLGRSSYELSGARKELQAWQKCHGGEVIAVQIHSGGVGVDMSRARYVIDYSLNFSYGDWEQSRSRLRRPGQTRQTVSIALLAEKTVDLKVWSALQRKKDVIEDILTSYKGDRKQWQ